MRRATRIDESTWLMCLPVSFLRACEDRCDSLWVLLKRDADGLLWNIIIFTGEELAVPLE